MSENKKFVACSYLLKNDDHAEFQSLDDEFWLGENEEYFEDQINDLLRQTAEDGGGSVKVRFEVWEEDPTCEVETPEALWNVSFPDDLEGGGFETAEAALFFISDMGPVKVRVTKVFRTEIGPESVYEVAPQGKT